MHTTVAVKRRRWIRVLQNRNSWLHSAVRRVGYDQYCCLWSARDRLCAQGPRLVRSRRHLLPTKVVYVVCTLRKLWSLPYSCSLFKRVSLSEFELSLRIHSSTMGGPLIADLQGAPHLKSAATDPAQPANPCQRSLEAYLLRPLLT